MNKKAWFDKCYVSITALSGAELALQTRTTNLNVSGGGFDLEGVETFGGKISKYTTREDMEIKMDGIPVSHAEFDWINAGQTTPTAFGISGSTITSSTLGTKYRVTFLWTNQSGVTGATQAITGSNEARRRSFCNAYCTSLEETQDAGDMLTCTINFKLAPEDDTGLQNWGLWAKDTTTGTLSALNAFTSSATKW